MLRANIEYEKKGLFGGDYDCIVTGPNGTKTFYGKESRDEAWNYYQSEKRLEDEIELRQKQSDLADMQMREIQERERRAQEERFHQKNTPPQFGHGGMSPHTMSQRQPAPTPCYDPEYIEFQKWKKENDPDYIKFKQEKARKTAEAERRKEKEEVLKQKEQEQQTIAEAKELLQIAKQQTQNKNLAKVQDKIAEIELLVQKGTFVDSLEAIEMLKKQYNWQLNVKETFKASLSNFDAEKILFEEAERERIANKRKVEKSKEYVFSAIMHLIGVGAMSGDRHTTANQSTALQNYCYQNEYYKKAMQYVKSGDSIFDTIGENGAIFKEAIQFLKQEKHYPDVTDFLDDLLFEALFNVSFEQFEHYNNVKDTWKSLKESIKNTKKAGVFISILVGAHRPIEGMVDSFKSTLSTYKLLAGIK